MRFASSLAALGELLLGRPTQDVTRVFWSINRASSFSFAEIIDDLANLVENTDERLRTETRRVTLVDRKSASCGERGGSEGGARVPPPREPSRWLSHVGLITAGLAALLKRQHKLLTDNPGLAQLK